MGEIGGGIKKCCDRGDAALSDRRALVVPRAGVEPARVAPLVFETSASTDSAIWACNLRCWVLQIGRKGTTKF